MIEEIRNQNLFGKIIGANQIRISLTRLLSDRGMSYLNWFLYKCKNDFPEGTEFNLSVLEDQNSDINSESSDFEFAHPIHLLSLLAQLAERNDNESIAELIGDIKPIIIIPAIENFRLSIGPPLGEKGKIAIGRVGTESVIRSFFRPVFLS